MSGKGHRGNTVDTKKSFRSQNIVLAMFMTKDKAIQQSKTTTLPGFYLISRNSSRRFPVNFELIKLSRTKIISFQNFTDCSSCQTAKHALLTPVTFPSFSKNLQLKCKNMHTYWFPLFFDLVLRNFYPYKCSFHDNIAKKYGIKYNETSPIFADTKAPTEDKGWVTMLWFYMCLQCHMFPFSNSHWFLNVLNDTSKTPIFYWCFHSSCNYCN